MKNSQLKSEFNELCGMLMTGALIVLPAVIAYYFCRDYRGKGNSPENAPMAAAVVLFVWTPFYLSVRQLFVEHKRCLNIGFLIVLLLMLIQVTLRNPKF